MTAKKTLLLFAWIASVLTLTGCTSPPEPYQFTFDPPYIRHYVGGESVQNRPLEYFILGQGEDTILIMATIHGNETAGTPLVLQLVEHFRNNRTDLKTRKVIIIPVANPDGMAQYTRQNANGIDLNRNFYAPNRTNAPGHGYTPLSEPESRFIHMLINQYKPARIVSIHQPLTCIDYDGPAEALARHMGKACDLPVKKLGARPGSLGAYAGETLKIPIVTLELPREADDLDSQSIWEKYGPSLLAAVSYRQPAK